MKRQNHRGTIDISSDVFTAITGHTAMGCFGVRGMAQRSVSDGIVQLLRGDSMAKGVKVTEQGERIAIELHIIVRHGVNIPSLCRSIMNEVSYTVQRLTGVDVSSVDVCIDAMLGE